jgi:hypothetical protein
MFNRRLPLPEPRVLPWPLKPEKSAETSLGYDACGRMVMNIRHDVLKRVTPEMVAWWFGNIGGDIEIEGRRLSRYLVWHPHDHILWQLARPGPDGLAGRGARFRIVETFGRNPAHYVDVTETVTRLDATGITLEGYLLGQQVTQLKHDFAAVEGGTLYLSSLTIGTAAPGLRWIVNPLIRRMVPEAMGRAWLKHNIEEVGLLEHIIPRLYQHRS